MGGLTEEANRPNRGPGAVVMGVDGHGWVRVELRVRAMNEVFHLAEAE